MDRPLYPITQIRTRLWLLLPLLLALAQQGAWLHELSHAAYAASPHRITVQQAENSFENGVCPSCQSFGQLASALAGPIATPAAAPAQFCPCTEPRHAPPGAQAPTPRNRGPPHQA